MTTRLKTILLSSLMFAKPLFAAVYISQEPTVTPRNKISLGFNMAYTMEEKPGIEAGAVTAGIPEALNVNIGANQNYGSYAIGVSAWYPLAKIRSFTIHGVTYVDHIPGGRSGAEEWSNGTVLSHVLVKTNRTNFAVGLNVYDFFRENWFYEAMISAGVSRMTARAEFWRDEFTTNQFSDHPGIISTSSFFGAELGVGYQLSERSRTYVFVNYGVSRRDKPMLLTSSHGSSAYISVRAPDKWLKLGLALARDINL